MTDEERALLERCGYDEADIGKEFGCLAFLVRPPYGNRFVDPRVELAFVRRVGEEAAAALASLTAVAGVNHARGVRALWDLDDSAAPRVFPRDETHLEELLAAARWPPCGPDWRASSCTAPPWRDIWRYVPEDCR